MKPLELEDIQGLIRHGYPYFKVASYLLMRIRDASGAKAWLEALRRGPEPWLDHAGKRANVLGKEDCGVALAFTAAGLRELGLGEDSLHSFVGEFQEGMATGPRSRFLGDIDANRPEAWDWGRDDEGLHLLLIVFAPEGMIAGPLREILALAGDSMEVLRRFHGVSVNEEPFGFADGISQPFVEGLTRKKPPPGVRAVKAGEFVLGYLNEFDRFPASPWVPADARAEGLPTLGGSERADFGRNGSFLAMRQLEQAVEAFDAFVGSQQAGGAHLAARMVGRWKSGAPLARHPGADPGPGSARENEAENDFGYHHEDRHGFRCPIGAHVRRANPRDSLADEAGITPEAAQALVDRHRILRRGRVYQEGERRGLLFLCLNANFERQFEFVQGSWLLNPGFGGLRGETDPLLGGSRAGESRSMSLQHPRLATRIDGLGRYVTVRGGAYFFVPGLKAIDYLSRC